MAPAASNAAPLPDDSQAWRSTNAGPSRVRRKGIVGLKNRYLISVEGKKVGSDDGKRSAIVEWIPSEMSRNGTSVKRNIDPNRAIDCVEFKAPCFREIASPLALRGPDADSQLRFFDLRSGS